MSELLTEDLMWCVSRLHDRVSQALHDHQPCFCAGGFIRSCIAGEPIHDVDLFAPSKASAETLAKALADGSPIIETGNAFTLDVAGRCVQVIHRWTFANAAECVAAFDFTIARAAIWWNPVKMAWESTCDERFYPDLAAKRLVYCQPQRNEDAGGSMLRVTKFITRGYRISPRDLGKVVARLMSGVELGKVSDGKKCDENRLSDVVAGLLLEVDPRSVDWAERRP